METAKKKRLLQCIKNVHDTAKENKLDSVMYEKIDGELRELSVYFKVSKMQAFFLVHLKNQFAITEELRNQFSIICQCRNCRK